MPVRMRFLFAGRVQGVGFRPFLWRQAHAFNLAGFVRNGPDGVVAEVEGAAAAVEAFLAGVRDQLPPLAEITGVTRTPLPPTGGEGFVIAASDAAGPGEARIGPDIATCAACLAELADPADRRFGYPFINCTNCGPRLTIVHAIPYDRSNTSMACFPMCPHCREEYENPADRRFHAEPNACPVCGPRLELIAGAGKPPAGDDPVAGGIALLKGGGFWPSRGSAVSIWPSMGKTKRPCGDCAPASAGRKSRWPSWSGTSTPPGSSRRSAPPKGSF